MRIGQEADREKETILLDFTNHYSKGLNKCFVTVEYHYSTYGASWVNTIVVYDVYENTKYGEFTENHIVDAKGNLNDKVMSCEVWGKNCDSLPAFNGLSQASFNK